MMRLSDQALVNALRRRQQLPLGNGPTLSCSALVEALRRRRNSGPEAVTLHRAAIVCGVNEGLIRDAIRRGLLAGVVERGRLRVLLSSLRAHMGAAPLNPELSP